MIAGGGAAGELGDTITGLFIHALDVWLAAHVQPGVKPGDGFEIFINQPNPGHLRIKGYRRNCLRFHSAGADTFPDGLGCRCVEILIFLFHHTRFGIKERHFD